MVPSLIREHRGKASCEETSREHGAKKNRLPGRFRYVSGLEKRPVLRPATRGPQSRKPGRERDYQGRRPSL